MSAPTLQTAPIPADYRPWSVAYPGYRPVDVTRDYLRPEGTLAVSVAEGWVTDTTTDPQSIDWAPRLDVALVPFLVFNGRPYHPAGRTGRTGRDLGKWGENKAADPIVVAGAGADREVLLILRDDCEQWAIPGGMVDPGETAPSALVRELREETGVDLTTADAVVLDRVLVDDPRATDHAWIASTVALFQLAGQITAQADSDALDAHWWPFGSLAQLEAAIRRGGGHLYEAHRPLLAMALAHLDQK